MDTPMEDAWAAPSPDRSQYPDPDAAQSTIWALPTGQQNQMEEERDEGGRGGEEYDFLEDDANDSDISDADSDYRNMKSDIAKFKESVRKFRATQHSDDSSASEDAESPSQRREKRGRGAKKGVLRGPRKAAEPTGDIKMRLGRASTLFIEERYAEAREEVDEIVRINAETYEAWTLLASINGELGDINRTFLALVFAAHLRPKDVSSWLRCAQFALEETGDQRPKYLSAAKFCFSSALRADVTNVEARVGRASIAREEGKAATAIGEYLYILKLQPHNTAVLRDLAELYIDQGKAENAKKLYRRSIEFYMSKSDDQEDFGWSDLNIYIELFGYQGQYAEAIRELKRLSRWLLGRQSESYWDEIFEDDREFDLGTERRNDIPDFLHSEYPPETYGMGLPLELRVKLGIYRLHLGDHDEAMSHLMWLDPHNASGEAKVFDYPDLFRDVATQLTECEQWQDALIFYEPLLQVEEQLDADLYFYMGKCYLKCKVHEQAESCLQTTIQLDDSNLEARLELAKLYEGLGERHQALLCVNDMMMYRRRQNAENYAKKRKRKDLALQEAQELPDDESFMPSAATKPVYRTRRLLDPTERAREEAARNEHVQAQYEMMKIERPHMRAGSEQSLQLWMDGAKDLIADFRSYKVLYPWDKYLRFLGYTSGTRAQPAAVGASIDSDLQSMATRLSRELGTDIDHKANLPVDLPENYRGITYPEWLDIFLEYALNLAKEGRPLEAYEICEAAKDAIVYYHSKDDTFTINICWCMCALIANDEETSLAVSRQFMKDYQFTTDAYRMFAAMRRVCQSPISWYTAGPTQKYVLRQIKAMDFAFADKSARDKYYNEKGSYSAIDESGRLLINDDLDAALLMLYGHILYTSSSYAYALNYFFRARALDPTNPVINLSIGLGYVHYALKRQTENRQYHIMHGLTFLFHYYETRKNSPHVEERQEGHYNIARAYHLLAVTHLAIPYYEKVLEEAKLHPENKEDLARDAAYNLQHIYATDGNLKLAKKVTEEWLTL